MWKNFLFTMWFQDFVTVFNQSYNCQTSHCLGRNRPPSARLSILLFDPWVNPIPTSWGRSGPLYYYWPPQIFGWCGVSDAYVVVPPYLTASWTHVRRFTLYSGVQKFMIFFWHQDKLLWFEWLILRTTVHISVTHHVQMHMHGKVSKF